MPHICYRVSSLGFEDCAIPECHHSVKPDMLFFANVCGSFQVHLINRLTGRTRRRCPRFARPAEERCSTLMTSSDSFSTIMNSSQSVCAAVICHCSDFVLTFSRTCLLHIVMDRLLSSCATHFNSAPCFSSYCTLSWHP